jgi:hypothetical protein
MCAKNGYHGLVRWWIALAVIAACGDNDAEVAYRDGSRLVSEWLVTDDGTRVPQGTVHDLARGEICYMQTWSDGVTRCTPFRGFIVYSDPACSQPAIIDADAAPGALAFEYLPTSCGPSRAFAIGAQTTTTTWYSPTAIGCQGPFTASNPLNELGAQADPDAFERLDAIDADGGRLGSRYYQARDGFRAPWAVYDHELATTCNPQDTACQPSSISSPLYTDAQCTQKVAITYPSPCSQDTVYDQDDDPACPGHYRYYRLGGEVTPAKLYQLDTSAGTCTAAAPSDGAQYHVIADEVTPAQLTRAQALASGKRLQPIYAQGDGVAVLTGRYYDSEVEVDCTFGLATDRTTRCLPSGPQYQSWFSDAACTKSVNVAYAWHQKPQCGAPDAVPAFATGYVQSTVEVRIVGSLYTSTLYGQTSGGCMPHIVPDYDAYSVGQLVDPVSFAAATLEVGP